MPPKSQLLQACCNWSESGQASLLQQCLDCADIQWLDCALVQCFDSTLHSISSLLMTFIAFYTDDIQCLDCWWHSVYAGSLARDDIGHACPKSPRRLMLWNTRNRISPVWRLCRRVHQLFIKRWDHPSVCPSLSAYSFSTSSPCPVMTKKCVRASIMKP